MTDSLKDEVREQLRSILTEVAQGGAKVLADPDVFDCAVKGGEIEITNLVWGVKELEWEPHAGNGFKAKCVVGDYKAFSSMCWLEGAGIIDSECDGVEAAKAACQRDFAKRIQAALTAKPAPVVSDDAIRSKVIEELRDSLEDDCGHMVPREWETLDVWQWLDSKLFQGEG